MFQKPRVIPCLTIQNNDLIKTVNFKYSRYLGDPINAVKIFNGKEVDELCILDISEDRFKREPNYELLKDIAEQAFMPLSYGGGIRNLDQIKKIINIGYEKVIINTEFITNPNLITEASEYFGSQSIVVAIDFKTGLFGKSNIYTNSGKLKNIIDPVKNAVDAEKYGAGEILLNSIDRDGKMNGYDLDMIKKVSSSIKIPMIASGGAASIEDFKKAIESGAHAVAASSMFVFYGKQKAVLITYTSNVDFSEKGRDK